MKTRALYRLSEAMQFNLSFTNCFTSFITVWRRLKALVVRTNKTDQSADARLEKPRHTRTKGKYYAWDFTPQSGIPNDVDQGSMGTVMKTQNVEFKDQNTEYSTAVKANMDPTRMLQDANDASLEEFFSRPVKIATYQWTVGNSLVEDFNPWQLYYENKRVGNRLTNYKLLRSKLHVKFVINGNGFFYGRLLAGYNPLDAYDDLSTFTTNTDLTQLSQLPHIFVDPTMSTGGDMVLPFFWHENYLDIPARRWRDMGRIYMRSLNNLKHANGAVEAVTISVFAWAEDVSFSVPTSQDIPGLVAQSGKESEVDHANTRGFLSGPATTVAKIAGHASKLPIIGPFALATENVASTVAGIAKLFGFSRPPVTKNPEPYRPTPISQLATTTTPDTALKLTVDDKQELTIDPSIAGIGCEDPLIIREIAKRESFLTSFDWQVTDTPESALWSARVDPCLWNETGVSPVAYHFPACCMVTMPFKYWTGSMKFRFQIVCSSFHKGRLKFVYDPGFYASDEYNTNYIQVVDIAQTQDFTLEFGNAQAKTLLTHLDPSVDGTNEGYNTTGFGFEATTGNGTLGVYVLNELTTPSTLINNDVQVNVFISMGDDFEVFVPDDAFQKFVFKPQSGAEGGNVPDSHDTDEHNAPQQEQSDMMAMPLSQHEMINRVFAGEAIVSFRPLLKRYNLWRREWYGGSTTSYYQKIKEMSAYPFLRGAVSGAVDTATGPIDYNFCNTLLMHWITNAHAGFRGGIRYKILFDKNFANSGNNYSSKVYIERLDPNPFLGYVNTEGAISGATSADSVSQSAIVGIAGGLASPPSGARGTVYATDAINNNVEFEVPYQTQFRFNPGKRENYTGPVPFINRFKLWTRVFGDDYSAMDFHVAAGEDFQVYFWTGLPRMYLESTPPTAA